MDVYVKKFVINSHASARNHLLPVSAKEISKCTNLMTVVEAVQKSANKTHVGIPVMKKFVMNTVRNHVNKHVIGSLNVKNADAKINAVLVPPTIILVNYQN